jgi:uncharacterized protein YegL
MNTITAAITAVELMFLTLYFQTKFWKPWSIQMTSGSLEQELKKEEFQKTQTKEHRILKSSARFNCQGKY